MAERSASPGAEIDKTVFARNLEHFRLNFRRPPDHELTQNELAALANLAPSTVSRLRNGQAAPTVETARRLARALKVQLEDLIYPGDHTSAGPPAGGRYISRQEFVDELIPALREALRREAQVLRADLTALIGPVVQGRDKFPTRTYSPVDVPSGQALSLTPVLVSPVTTLGQALEGRAVALSDADRPAGTELIYLPEPAERDWPTDDRVVIGLRAERDGVWPGGRAGEVLIVAFARGQRPIVPPHIAPGDLVIQRDYRRGGEIALGRYRVADGVAMVIPDGGAPVRVDDDRPVVGRVLFIARPPEP